MHIASVRYAIRSFLHVTGLNMENENRITFFYKFSTKSWRFLCDMKRCLCIFAHMINYKVTIMAHSHGTIPIAESHNC